MEILTKSQNFIEVYCSAQSSWPSENVSNTNEKTPEKEKLNFSLSALYLMKTKDYLKYFVLDSSYILPELTVVEAIYMHIISFILAVTINRSCFYN